MIPSHFLQRTDDPVSLIFMFKFTEGLESHSSWNQLRNLHSWNSQERSHENCTICSIMFQLHYARVRYYLSSLLMPVVASPIILAFVNFSSHVPITWAGQHVFSPVIRSQVFSGAGFDGWVEAPLRMSVSPGGKPLRLRGLQCHEQEQALGQTLQCKILQCTLV